MLRLGHHHLKVAGDTVCRNPLRPVALDTEPHVDLYRPYGYGHAADISMTAGTIHPGTDMGSVIKFHMGRWREAVNALPGHIQAGVEIRCQLLHSRTIGHQKLMASHAHLVVRDSCYRTFVDPDMTGRAGDTVGDVFVMWKCDRLYRCGTPPNEFLDRIYDRGVLEREEFAFRRAVIS
jgi:hypothetical protein